MKRFILAAVVILSIQLNAQKIGEMAPDEPPMEFPPVSFGFDVLVTEGGIGIGTFLRRSITQNLTAFADISISESKDDKEVEYYDYYFGQSYVENKLNRVFLIPLNFGVQYRLFSESLTDNLRPYINAGLGPSLVLSTPYIKDGEIVEFFNSFKYSHPYYTLGGYLGFGADFGLSREYLIGINVRYVHIELMNEGIPNISGKQQKRFGGIFLTINLGFMY